MADGLMRAAVLETSETALKIEEIPIPEPKAGEVLVRVTACGVCHTDLHVIKNEVASRRRRFLVTRSRGPWKLWALESRGQRWAPRL